MAPSPPLRPGPVDKESPASQPLHNLQSELLAAKAAWEQLGTRIAKGYTTAYGLHEKTLKDMEAEKKAALSNDALIFVLSIISVGFAGGLVGSLVAPWVDKAGPMLAKKVFRASVVAGVGTQAVQTVTDAGVKKVLDANPASDPYKPSTPKEIAVDQDIRDRIGSAFGPVLEALDAMIATANQIQAPVEAGQNILNNFRQNCPLMTDKPAQDDMPTERQAADAAELAMWVVWANERDWPWWNKVYAKMDAGYSSATQGGWTSWGETSAQDYAAEMDPVGNRLAMLGKWGATYSAVHHEFVKGYHQESDRDRLRGDTIIYTDLRKLRALRLDDGNLPFKRLSGLHMQWDKTKPFERAKFLSRMEDVKPIYKK